MGVQETRSRPWPQSALIKEYARLCAVASSRQNTKGGAIVSIQKCLIEAMDGNLVGGLFMSQILFWAGKDEAPRRLVLSQPSAVVDEDYINRSGRQMGCALQRGRLAQTKVSKAGGAPVTHYRIDYARLALWLAANGLSISTEGLDEMDTSLDMQMSADPIQTHTYTNTQTAVSSVDAGGGPPDGEAGDRAPEVGQKSAQDSDSLSGACPRGGEVTGLSAACRRHAPYDYTASRGGGGGVAEDGLYQRGECPQLGQLLVHRE